MGAVLSVPHARMTRWYDGLDELRQAGFHLLALTPSADAVALDEVVRPERFALVLGSEGEGLSTRWLSAADMRVRIPMRAGIDSLNVAACRRRCCGGGLLRSGCPPHRRPDRRIALEARRTG